VRTLVPFSLVVVLVAMGPFITTNAARGSLPSVGQLAPGFTLPSQDGSEISLDSFRGKWVVLYFYRKDLTTGCTIEAHNFQRDLAQYQAKNAVILGVSVDTAQSHRQFCTKEGVSFRLLSDTDHAVVEAYGSLGSYGGVAVADRNTFLIDPEGKISRVWTMVNPQVHSNEVLAAIPGSQNLILFPGLRKLSLASDRAQSFQSVEWNSALM
jgi:thioredoxin-dependent peroxiredoxin